MRSHLTLLSFVRITLLASVLCSVVPKLCAARDFSAAITPTTTGEQLVRTSLPLPRGLLAEGRTLVADDGHRRLPVAVRVLSWYPSKEREVRSGRRVLVTFPYSFKAKTPIRFTFNSQKNVAKPTDDFPIRTMFEDGSLTFIWTDGNRVELRLLAPQRTSTNAPRVEIVEHNQYFRWQRLHLDDPQWPRVIELRMDALGGVVVVAHLQRNLADDGRAPDFGWELHARSDQATLQTTQGSRQITGTLQKHAFTNDDNVALQLFGNRLTVYHPVASLKRRGFVEARFTEGEQLVYHYLRCTAEELVPMQPESWHRAEIVIAPANLAHLTPTLLSPHRVEVDAKNWDALYGKSATLAENKLPEELQALVRFHSDAIVRSMAVGDDLGNVTSYSDAEPHGGIFGMNRLNHCAPIFEEAWRGGDTRLRDTALLWCDNFYNQSVWWGDKERGGTRYNNIVAMNRTPPDKKYMWRSNGSVNFCTKGYAAFWLAWEETGDPRMKEALDAQLAYAAEHLHADRGECRNIGDVRDFVDLYRYTGEQRYLDEALRLFRELRSKLSLGDLFDQGGKPIDPDPPFIEEDQGGLKVGYAKPYIIGYALAGLPELARLAPDEPKLRDTVRAVADFLAASQDPLGGWRYPHPRSSGLILGQALEHAWQITQAAKLLGPERRYLDAIERVLRQRIHGWRRTGQIFAGLSGWEITTGKVKSPKELYDLYKKPSDRDATRDYTEGAPGFGSAPPEGLVYFNEVLAYYLEHRPASRLLAEPKADEPLGQVLSRVPLKQP
ncbi:MAG: hypothetical protein HY298_21735 [Verrucomicrobia bacterium]|nr:hypothetical protein [Verrucomicrobiota bacterium]